MSDDDDDVITSSDPDADTHTASVIMLPNQVGLTSSLPSHLQDTYTSIIPLLQKQPQQPALPLIDEDLVVPGSALLPAEDVDDASTHSLADVTASALAAGKMQADAPFAHDPYSKAAVGTMMLEGSIIELAKRGEAQAPSDSKDFVLPHTFFFDAVKDDIAASKMLQEIELPETAEPVLESLLPEDIAAEENAKRQTNSSSADSTTDATTHTTVPPLQEADHAFKMLVQEQLGALEQPSAEDDLVEFSAPVVSMIVDLGDAGTDAGGGDDAGGGADGNARSNANLGIVTGNTNGSTNLGSSTSTTTTETDAGNDALAPCPDSSQDTLARAETSAAALQPPPQHLGVHKGLEMTVKELVGAPLKSAMDTAVDLEIEAPVLQTDLGCCDHSSDGENDGDNIANSAVSSSLGGSGLVLQHLMSNAAIHYQGKPLADGIEESAVEEEDTRLMLEDAMGKIGTKGKHVMDRAVETLSLMAQYRIDPPPKSSAGDDVDYTTISLAEVMAAVGAKPQGYQDVELKLAWDPLSHLLSARSKARDGLSHLPQELSNNSSSSSNISRGDSAEDVFAAGKKQILDDLVHDIAATAAAAAPPLPETLALEGMHEDCILSPESPSSTGVGSSAHALDTQPAGSAAPVAASEPHGLGLHKEHDQEQQEHGNQMMMETSPSPALRTPPSAAAVAAATTIAAATTAGKPLMADLKLAPHPAAPAAPPPTMTTLTEADVANAAIAAAFWASDDGKPLDRLQLFLKTQGGQDDGSSAAMQQDDASLQPQQHQQQQQQQQLPSPVKANEDDVRTPSMSPSNSFLDKAAAAADAAADVAAAAAPLSAPAAFVPFLVATAQGGGAIGSKERSATDPVQLYLDDCATTTCTELYSIAQSCYTTVAEQVPSLNKHFDLTSLSLPEIELLVRTVASSDQLRTKLELLHTCKATVELLLAFGSSNDRTIEAASRHSSVKRIIDLAGSPHAIVAALQHTTTTIYSESMAGQKGAAAATAATEAAAAAAAASGGEGGGAANGFAHSNTAPLIAVVLPAAGGAAWHQSICRSLAPELEAIVWKPRPSRGGTSGSSSTALHAEQIASVLVISSDDVDLLPPSWTFKNVIVYSTQQQRRQVPELLSLTGTFRTIQFDSPTFVLNIPSQLSMQQDQQRQQQQQQQQMKVDLMPVQQMSNSQMDEDVDRRAASQRRPSFTFLCSSAVTSNPSLLQMLEQMQDISMIEAGEKRVQGMDLVLSCTTGIKLVDARDLVSGGKACIMAILSSVIKLAEAYGNMHIIVQSFDGGRDGKGAGDSGGASAWSPEETTAFSQLKACIWPYQMPPLANRFKLQLHVSSSSSATSSLIRMIADVAYASTPEAARDLWDTTDWLHDQRSLHETVLLGFPSLNSFSAQYLLSCFSLKEFAEADLETLAMTCPAMTTHALKCAFHMLSTPSANFDPTSLQECIRQEHQGMLPLQEHSTTSSPTQSSPGEHDTSYLWQSNHQGRGGGNDRGGGGADGTGGAGRGGGGGGGGGGGHGGGYGDGGSTSFNGSNMQHGSNSSSSQYGYSQHDYAASSGGAAVSVGGGGGGGGGTKFGGMQQQVQHEETSDIWDDGDSDSDDNDVWKQAAAASPQQQQQQQQQHEQQQQQQQQQQQHEQQQQQHEQQQKQQHEQQQHKQRLRTVNDGRTGSASRQPAVAMGGGVNYQQQHQQSYFQGAPQPTSKQQQQQQFAPQTPQDPPAPAPYPNKNSMQGTRAKRRRIDPTETLSFARGSGKGGGGQTTLQFQGEVPRCATGLWPLEPVKAGGGSSRGAGGGGRRGGRR